MNDRLITAAGAVLALAILYAMFFQPAEPEATRPVTTETGRNGYAAVSRWLTEAGVPVVSWRRRFDDLSGPDRDAEAPRAARGNVLITTMPHRLPVRSRERERLLAWVRGGNTLLILAALHDTPEWAPDTSAMPARLEALTGLRFAAAGPARGAPAVSGSGAEARRTEAGSAETGSAEAGSFVYRSAGDLEIDAVAGHPLMRDVTVLRGHSDAPTLLSSPVVRKPHPLLLRIAVEHESGIAAAWQRPYGDGQMVIVASGSVLTNHMVAQSDAGPFLMNVVRHHLAGGAVIFDDMHQGLSVIYDASAFFSDLRLHRTLWFLLGAWLVYLLGSSNRLAPPLVPRPTPRQRDFLEAVGGFMARRLSEREAGSMMLERWFDEVRHARGLPDGEPPWESLRETPTLARSTFEQLRQYHAGLKAGRKVDLVRLHNTLRTAREAIG